MNESANRISAHQSQHPENQENPKNRPKHSYLLSGKKVPTLCHVIDKKVQYVPGGKLIEFNEIIELKKAIKAGKLAYQKGVLTEVCYKNKCHYQTIERLPILQGVKDNSLPMVSPQSHF
jgi:hypothetical protein